MFEKNYYCLVAGLREYTLESEVKGFDAKEIISEVMEELSQRDCEAVREMYGYYDCENIIALRAGRSAFNHLGNFTREELEQELVSPQRLPERLAKVVRAFADQEGEDAEGVDFTRTFENVLYAAYYCLLYTSPSPRDS